jgi:hypothetical protein
MSPNTAAAESSKMAGGIGANAISIGVDWAGWAVSSVAKKVTCPYTFH